MKRCIVVLLSLGLVLFCVGACDNDDGDGGSTTTVFVSEQPYGLADLVGTWDFVIPADEIYQVVVFDSNGIMISRKQGGVEITTLPEVQPYKNYRFVVKPNGNAIGIETLYFFHEKFTKTWTMAFRNRTTIKGKIRMVCPVFNYDTIISFYMIKR